MVGIEAYNENGSVALDSKHFPLVLARSRRLYVSSPYLGPDGFLKLTDVPLNRLCFISSTSASAVGVYKNEVETDLNNNTLIIESKAKGFYIDLFEFDFGVILPPGDFGVSIKNEQGFDIFNSGTYLVGIAGVASSGPATSIPSGTVAFCNTMPLMYSITDGSGGFGGAVVAAGITQGATYTPRLLRYTYGMTEEAGNYDFSGDVLLIDCSRLPVPYTRPT